MTARTFMKSLRYPLGVLGLALQRHPKASLLETSDSSKSESSKLQQLSRFTYMSTMCGDTSTAATNVEKIVSHAVCRNVQRNISGHLVYDAQIKKVWQVFEGNRDAIADLWERIAKDSRHVIDEATISNEVVDDRRYPLGWGVRYTKIDKAADQETGPTPVSRDSKPCELVQVKYKSFLKEDGSSQLQITNEVIPRAIAKNAKIGITGFLLYDENTMTVYQVLEGPADVVETLFDQIQKDPRHRVCAASVQKRAIQEREFPNWSMALEHVERSVWAAAAGY